MQLRLDPRSGKPIYLQIAGQIKHLIAAGKMRPNDQLPTVRQLAVELRVDPNTVARGYRQLVEEGLISTQQGRGTYVLEPPPPADQRQLRREKLIAVVDGLLNELDRLGFSDEELEKVWSDRLALWQRARMRRG